MGRKRLLTLLAGLVAAMGLQAAPAMAQSLELPGASVSTEDGLEVELDVQVTDDLEVNPEVKVGADEDGPKVELDGGVKVGETEVDLGEVTDELTEPPSTDEPAPELTPTESPDDGDNAADDGDNAADDGGNPSDGGGDTSGDQEQIVEPTVQPTETSAEQERRESKVTTSGGVANWAPERQKQFEAFQALRSRDFGFGSAPSSSVLPGVELAPRRVGEEAEAENEVGTLVYDEPEVAPGVAAASPEPSDTDATLASAAGTTPMQEVPVPLQALTGVLIAGTALAWHLTRRELGWALSGLRQRS